MMNRVSKGLLVLAALVPAVSQAQQPTTPLPELSYNYAELSYDESDFDLDSDNVDGDGLTLSGSFELTEDWHAYAAYSTSDLDDGIDVDGWAIGAGYRYPLQDNVDIYGRVLYINREVDGPGPVDAEDDGLGLQARIRMRVSEVFEVEGGIQHLDVGDSDTALQASARYHFTRNFSAGIGMTFAGDTDSLGINARYTF
jgi:hypothetical protein